MIEYGQDAPLDFCTRAHGILATAHDNGVHAEVVCESFIFRPDSREKTRQYEALYQIGTLMYLVHWLGHPDLIMQSPADAKRLISNQKLRDLGWWAVGMDHARDALRHLAYRCLKRGMIVLPGSGI